MWSWSQVGDVGRGVTWPITRHTEESFVGAGATLSAPLFWLSLHAPVPQQIHVCEGCECNIQVNLWKPVSLTKCFSLSFFFFFGLPLLACHTPLTALEFILSFYLTVPNLVKYGYNRFAVFLEFSVVILNGRKSCLSGYRHVHRKK